MQARFWNVMRTSGRNGDVMLELDQIDFNELYKLLLIASRKAFRFVRESHPDETFYAFGLYYYQPSKFIFPTCNSEEAHLRYGNLAVGERENQSLRWFYERWETSEWAYYALGKKYFYPVGKWIDQNLRGRIRPRDQYLMWANMDHKLLSTCLKVLKTLDEEKFFGEGIAREQIVLTLTLGSDIQDPYVDEGEYIRLLNPMSAYLRWRTEAEMCDHAQAFLDR